ncbi:prepilin-type N-terminal cleavage/methylation domain-containing protein [Acinetobacter sp. MD2(2019)]|uniref:type IV pilin protein n=1 Tax=Acinetobacter sp. MD2(2019) TaxID=2605273 RepID=UPI002D1E70B3|nr:prepilin-type N-terminal cleavage/methylation domain-containing protein [Acinetobacter sp. MD2(2019)]MEB3753253.1 prepilin-type N-terminal cleavage/methylation domain-containing protein [Acinetobacter sp. MD2(2019)]
MRNISSIKGFTLIELMVVVVIVAILAAIAIPSYQEYARRSRTAQAEQEMQRLAVLLERSKSRNFSYKSFSTVQTTVADKTQYPYTISVVDGSSTTTAIALASGTGQSWAINATTTDPRNYSLLMTSSGIRCKNKTSTKVTYASCGTTAEGSENW